MNLYDSIKQADAKLADKTAGSDSYFYLSPTRVSLSKVLFPAIERHIRGRCLDAGAGRTAYKTKLLAQADEVVSLDWQRREALDCSGSVMELPFQDNVFDSVFCSQVLEHVPSPEQALQEFHRCLKPGGSLVISVPHLAYLHNEPHDYFRYTKHGLRVMLERNGFDVIDIHPAGGLLSFLGHIPSVIAKALFARVPVVGSVVMFLNRYYSQFVSWLDGWVDKKKLFALNYVVVGTK